MAETVVSFAVERLGELLISEIKHLRGLNEKVEEIRLELKRMQCFLKEADKKQIQDDRVKNWVAEIRELAFQIEDVIETFAMKVATKNQKSDFKKMVRRFACILCEGASRHNISSRIDAQKGKITSITTSLDTYGIKGLPEGETSSSDMKLRSTRISYSHIVEKDFVGMKKELKQLISSLKKKDKGCEVVSICGMGGQGKTTLAQKLYNHTQVEGHFQKLAWFCVTQHLDRDKVLKDVLKQLIDKTRKEQVSDMNDGELVRELYQVQKEYNCLVVLDDIWTLDSWRQLKDAFPVGETTSGSKILLTTRNETVAGIGLVHRIQDLTTEEGWQLLSKKSGISDILSDPIVLSQMERIGRDMIEKCKHLPLAISSIGGILNGKLLEATSSKGEILHSKLLDDWKRINKDIFFYLGEGGVIKDDEYYTVRQLLGLSYDSLPSPLKHCFLCFANFKEDKEISVEELYVLWTAEGLISVEHKAEGMMLLDVAESLLDELAHRSLVQVEKNTNAEFSWSKYETCSLHDLIRDLCLFKAKQEKFINVVHLQPQPEDETRASKARRLCINPYNESTLEPYDKDMISHVRSLFVVSRMFTEKSPGLQNFKLLRTFTAHGFRFTKQDLQIISKLVYLKCLSLWYCKVEELPSSISNLRNLEILGLTNTKVLMVANVLWKLKHLKLEELPSSISNLRNLEILDLAGSQAGMVANVLWKLKCRLPKEHDHTGFSSSCLSNLALYYCRMEEDPMILLEKLSNLRKLHLNEDAYLGTEMRVGDASGRIRIPHCLKSLQVIRARIRMLQVSST